MQHMHHVDRTEIAPPALSRLAAILVCLDCHGALEDQGGALVCRRCARAYAVRDGIPEFADRLQAGERLQQARHDALYGENDAYERYFQRPLFRLALERYVRPLLSARVGTVLELGCGRGQFSAWLALRAARGIGVDVSLAGLRAAQAVRPAGWDYLQASARGLPLPEASVDLVFSHFLLHHVEDLAPVLAEIRRVLRPGGRLIAWEPAVRVPWVEAWLRVLAVPRGAAEPLRRAYANGQRRWARDDGFGRAGDDGVHFFRPAGAYQAALAQAAFAAEARTAVVELIPPRYLESGRSALVAAQLAASDALMRCAPQARVLGKFLLITGTRP